MNGKSRYYGAIKIWRKYGRIYYSNFHFIFLFVCKYLIMYISLLQIHKTFVLCLWVIYADIYKCYIYLQIIYIYIYTIFQITKKFMCKVYHRFGSFKFIITGCVLFKKIFCKYFNSIFVFLVLFHLKRRQLLANNTKIL